MAHGGTYRFQVGDRVRTRAAYPRTHCRTPFYLRGKPGVIERRLGAFGNSEELAYGRSGLPQRNLYIVRYEQRALWPDYAGAAGDTVTAEIQEHWLEPA